MEFEISSAVFGVTLTNTETRQVGADPRMVGWSELGLLKSGGNC